MAIIRELKGDRPVIGERAFLAETATIIGTVTMGDDCSVWYGAVLRGDVGAIRIGDRVNIQDNAVLHATYQQSECVIGNDVSIGHGANVHGAVIGNHRNGSHRNGPHSRARRNNHRSRSCSAGQQGT